MAFAYSQGTVLGAPNIYRASDELRRTLGAERMDVCAFVGVAPRGPSRVPIEPEYCQQQRAYVEQDRPRQRSVAVPVNSWDDYVRLYGGFDGPGRLPYAVASFFEQGGVRAYIVRIVHHYGNEDDFLGVARTEVSHINSSGVLPTFVAKNEGAWGNQLRGSIGYQAHPLGLLPSSTIQELRLPYSEYYPVGTLLRLTIEGSEAQPDPTYEFRFVVRQGKREVENSTTCERFLLLNTAASGTLLYAEVIEAELLIEDGQGFKEHFDRLGLSPNHPRWLASVIYRESELINPEESWLDAILTPSDIHHIPKDGRRYLVEEPLTFSGGEDRYTVIEHEDFFDTGWVLGNPQAGDGIHALTHLKELSLLVVPDLYVPEPLPEKQDDRQTTLLAGADFAPCVSRNTVSDILNQANHRLPGLQLNPLFGNELEQIIQLQIRVVELASTLRQFIALLDVPPGIQQREIFSWRAHFTSDFSVAYFPWVNISSLDDSRDNLILVNPSAVAAGIIARQELTFGVFHGPANVLARNVVSVDEKISALRHDALHPQGINVFLPQRDGVWLSAARTLSRGQHYRQLSVRRLMSMLQRVLYRQMQWVVFEPNHHGLWAQIRHLLNNFLRQLYIAGAFKGSVESQAFFVRCDGELNHQRVLDAGQLIVEIGVAPAELLEFIIVRITRGGDGTLSVESQR
ncbi:hypothetical protein AB835_00695 [Candidatus Endobugula sertula]|uniref:Tail sheath protein C-terminal domain-containing protein n=1 Tax=Candidatus Endobugula sertula TaxID=62101 RepID=A0A1D2QTZ4_9GAMM|nr:hypothetical protein AB835_00695 [Candidatus Endobugula sertula]